MRTDYCAWHLSQKRSITCHYVKLTTVGTFTIVNKRLCSFENCFACSFFQFLKLRKQSLIGMVALCSNSDLCLNVEDGTFSVRAQEHLHTQLIRYVLPSKLPVTFPNPQDPKRVMPVYWVSQDRHWKFTCNAEWLDRQTKAVCWVIWSTE